MVDSETIDKLLLGLISLVLLLFIISMLHLGRRVNKNDENYFQK